MPDWKQEISGRLANLNLEAAREAAIIEELSQHLDDCYEELSSSGATAAEAYRETLSQLSESELLARELRRVEREVKQEPIMIGINRRGNMIADLWQDLRFGAHLLMKNPGFTLIAVITLALCTGANLTIFAVVDSVLLRLLPFPEADRLVTVFNTYPKAGVERDGCSITNYYERRGNIAAFSDLAACREGTAVIGEAGSTQREHVMQVSPDFFATLGVNLLMGRAFTDEETTYQTDSVAILTDAYWRQHFNADLNVIGREIRVDGFQRKVIGVLPPGFRYLSSKARLYFPLASNVRDRAPDRRHWGSSTEMIARLKPGITLTEAQSQIDAHNDAMEKDDPEAKMMAEAGFHSLVVGLHADHVASIRPTLLLMQAGVLFLLLIGGVNLVNLLLIHASSRTKEFAIRQSLGASRGRMVSQVMTENVLLTLVGGLFGLVVAAGGIKLLAALGADQLPLGARITFDGRLALAALAGAVLIGVVIGLPVAAYNLRPQLGIALQSETRGGTTSRAAQRLRHGFIVAQIALAFVLLTGAGLLGLSLKRVMAVSPGFRPESTLSGQILLPWKNYSSTAARIAFIEELMERIGSQPGVSAAGIITNVPLSGINIKSAISPKGYVRLPGESLRGHYSYGVAGDYFAALNIPLREGRYLEGADLRREQRVCLVDEDFARRYWPQGNAIGQSLFQGGQERPDAEAFTIVGVVGAVKQAELTENQAQGAVYFPYSHRPDGNIFVAVRTGVLPEALAPTLQNVVRGIDPEIPVNDLRSMGTRISDSLVARRSSALLIGLFAGVALLLTAIGTYGVLSYAVAQRRREIGIRMALGAQPWQIGSQFLGLGLRLLAVGTILGIAGAWMAGRAMQSILFNVPALQLAILVGTAAIIGVVALVACWLPARRAARVDPQVALRSE
jgi:predicted permease